MQAIDFRPEDHRRAVHDPLVRAWWNDTGFVGRCPQCGGWIHFTIRAKRAITADTALRLGRYFGMSPEFWLNLQTHYDLEQEQERLAKRLDKEVKALAAA